MQIDISKLSDNNNSEEISPSDKKYLRDIPEKNRVVYDDEEELAEEAVKEEEYIPTGILLTSFEYDVTNKEEEKAFTIFQKKYVYKHNWRITALFGVVALLFMFSIVRNPSGYLNWVLCFVSLFMIFITWFNTYRIKKYLMNALKPLENDRYRFSLYEDCFKIETIFTPEETKEEDFVPVKPRVVKFDDITLNVIETKEMFVILLRKETIYVLSKRVVGLDDQELLKKKFKDLLGKDYEKYSESR